MDGELTPWNKHGSHNSRVPFHIEGEQKEDNDLIGDSFAAREPMSSLSSCMSGAFKALLPDYHETSSEMTTNSVKYSYSHNNHCLIKPGTAVDENIVERREKSNFLKDPLCEASASVTHMLPPRCSQYVPEEKDRDMDQGNCNWTSVIKDALEMSNGMEMEPTLSMDVCGPLMDFNAVYKGPETEAKITLTDHYQIAGSKVNEQDGQGVKAEPDSFISMLSDGLDKKKDVLEMGENDEPSILDVGSSLGKEELGMTGFRENEPEFLPELNRSSYTPFSSSKGFMKREKFPGIPSVKQSIEHTLQGTTQGPESCRDVSPSETASTDICFKHATGNNKTVPEGSTIYGLHHLDLQKDCHLADVTDGNTSVNYLDHTLPHHVQDKNVNTSNLHVSETNTDNSEIGLKMETDQTVVFNKIHLDYKCKDSQIEPGESGKINPSTVLLPCDEKVQNSEKNENQFLNITSESSIPPPTENVHAALLSPTSRLDCSSQPNLQEALQKRKKSRKRRKSELEELLGPVVKPNKRDECSVYGSGISDSAVKPDLIPNGDANPPSPRRKLLCHSQLQMTQLELVNDIAETSQKPDHGCSENSQVKASSAARIDRKAVSRRKLKNRTKLCLKAKKSARSSSNQFLSSTVLSSEEDCMAHFQVSDATLVKEVGNPAIIQQAISGLESSIPECSPKKSTKKKALQTEKYALLTLQSKGDPPDDPTTFSEVEEDLMDFKRHKKTRRPGGKASKGKNKHATSLLSSQPILEAVSQTDSVSTSVTESSNIQSPQKNPKKSRQKKRPDINKGPKSPQDNFSLPLSKSKENMVTSNTMTVKEKRSLKKATKTDDCDTTLLGIQPSTQKKTDSAPTSGTEVEPPVIFSTPRKSLKKKLSNIKPEALHITTVDQTIQSVLNPLSEFDAGIVQPTTRRFSPRKTFNFFSHSTVSENSETVQLNESISSDDSVSATVTEISGFSLKNTEKPSSKRRKININYMEAQTSNTSQKEDVTVLPLEDFASIVVSNTEKTVKVKRLSRNKTCDNRLNDHLVEDTSLLAFVTQENSISPLKTDSSSSFRQIKKPRKKTATKIKNEAEDLVAITLKPSANMVASSSHMTLKEKILVEKAITDEMKDNHATSLFLMQTSTATLQHTECASTSFAHSTQKKSKKMSDNKGEAVHTPAVDQSLQQESFDSPSTAEMDNSDSLNQKNIQVKTKRQRKKVSRRSVEPSFPVTVHQENSVSNRNTNCEEMTQKRAKKKTSPLKVQHFQPEDYAEHSSVSPALLPPPISLGKDATQDPCRKTDIVKESADSHVENQVVTTEDVACSQSLLKKAKKTRRKQLLVQKEVNEQSNILELTHREDKKSDAPSVVQEAASENFEMLEADTCDQHLKVAKKKGKKSKQIAEKHEFANVSLSQEKNTGSNEAGVMVTFTQIQDFCKLPDGQAVGSQQPEKDGDVVNQKDVIKEGSGIKDLKTTKNPKTKGRKAGRKKRKIAGLVTQTVEEEEHKDVSYDNRIAFDFQNNTQIQISDGSQRTGVIPEEPVMKSRKSTRTQKTNLGSFVENMSTQGSLDITACHTRLDETLYSSMQPSDCENQYTVEEQSPRQGKPPSIKSKEHKSSIAHLEGNASSSVQILDLTSCQDSTEIPSSSMQPTDCEVQYTVKQKSPRRRRPPSIKSKKQKLPTIHLEDETLPSVQISDPSSCQDCTETLSNSIQPADCEGQYTKQKSPRRGRPPSNKNKKPKLSLAHLEDNTSPSVQILDPSSFQESTETLSSSMQPTDCEVQYTVKQKSPRQGKPPSIKSKKQKLPTIHLEDETPPSVQISDLSSCQDSTETLSNSIQPADCEGQYTKQKSPRRGRPPSIKSKEPKSSIAHLEDNASSSVQILDLTSCQDSTEIPSSSMQPTDCEVQYTVKQKSPRRRRPPSIKSKKQKLPRIHLEDETPPSVQISDPSSCQDCTETLSNSIQPADCEGQYTKQKSPRRGRPPSNKNKKPKLSLAHLEDNTSPSVQISDPSSCQESTETLSSSMQPTDCEVQYTVNQKSPRRGKPPSIKSKKQKLPRIHLEDETPPSVQISDPSSCQDSTETLSSSIQPADCEDQYTKQKSPRRGRPPSNKNKKSKLSFAHLEDNTSPSVQISDLSSCQDSTENTVKAAASPAKQKVVQPLKKRKVVKVDNVMVTSQLGTDPSESLQTVTDDLSHNIPALKHKKGKNFKRLKLSSLIVSSRTSEPSVKGFQKTDIHSLPQNSTNDFNEKGQTSLPMPGTVKKQEDVLADITIENKATVKAVKGGKRGRKRQITEHEELQILTTKAKNNKRQDCFEPAKSFLTKFSITNESSTEDQSIVSSEKNNEKTKLSSVEMVPAISVGTFQIPKTEVLCSSSTQLSSNLMKDDKNKEHDAEPNGKDLFSVIDNAGLSGVVSSGICNLITCNLVKKELEDTFLDTKINPNTELKCTQETDGLRVTMSGETIIDNSSEIENAFQTSTEQRVNVFTQDVEECVVMPSKGSNKRRIRSKPKEIMKPLTCKYCGVSFRHITAYAIHQRIHTGDKPYKCKICGKSFACLSKLKSHRNVHKQDTSFPCPCCSQKFFQKEDLLCHFQVHLQESKANGKPHNAIKSKKNTSSDVCSETPNNYGRITCKKNFVNQVKLQNHMQAHEVEKPLTCKDCGKKFWKASSLAAHGKSHWPVKPYACSICGKGFTRLKALQKHSQDHAGETPFSCFHCGHAFSALSELRMHQASKTCIARKNDEASGSIEGFIVSQGVDGQVNTPVFFKCQICKQLFRKWCQYTLHLQTHTSSPPYICFSCGQCYEKDSEMNVHCEVCCQSSGEEQICGASLSEQMQSVTQVYPLKCTSSQTLPSTGIQQNSQTQTCSEQLPRLPQSMDVVPTQTRDAELSQLPKTCSTQSPIQLPVAQSPNHSDAGCSSTSSSVECIEISPSLRKFKCSRCGQRFEQYRTLSAHLQMHAPGFRYTCAHCGQFFERWSKLWLHQRRHRLKSHRYSCNQCNLQFHFFSSFKEHMINHAGQRPYACPLCPKTFIQEASLHAHQCESHKLYKSLKCDVCCKTFSSLTNLIKHSLLHNGSTSHICLPCNLPFTNTRVLKEHLKTHTTHHRPALPDIPKEPLDFPHKCKRCKASFSTGDLLYAHQIRHSRDPTTLVRPALVPTSKLSDSCCNDTSTPSTTRRNPISNLKLDGIPNDESLYVYSHPDRLYMPPSRRAQIPVINLDPDAHEEVSDSQNISPEPPNREITAQSDSTHLPQATSGEETPNLKETAGGNCNYSRRYRRSRFVETSVDMELETTVQEESESFECADCTEKLSSVLSLYEHYILHALGDTYVH